MYNKAELLDRNKYIKTEYQGQSLHQWKWKR